MAPDVSVVVPSHDRPLRLRWLLEALATQDLDPSRFEVIVVHDSGDDTEALLSEHLLKSRGTLRHHRFAAGTGEPGRQRNTGWRMARSPLVAFTDDDCRPEADWLSRLLEVANANRGAIVQGTTRPDPYEAAVALAPHARTLDVSPPGPYGQTCNILYPRSILEATGGFVEEPRLDSGEDTDLLLRARALGAAYIASPEAVVFHAVHDLSLRAAIRMTRKWADLAYVAKHHPSARELLVMRVFWRARHRDLLLAWAGLILLSRGHRLGALLCVPYARDLGPRRPRPKALAANAVRAPGRVLIDHAELATCVRGSARHRTLFL